MKPYLKIFIFMLCALIGLTSAYAGNSQVMIKDFAYVPSVITVSTGTTVTWTNTDDDPHTVTDRGDKQLFHSNALDTNEKFSYTFATPGTYEYFCKLHPHMMGKVIVTNGK